MGGAASHTVTIPRFPFHNRELERAAIEAFLTQKERGARIILLEGEGGLGKSRLLSECVKNIDHSVVVTILNARESGGIQRTLTQSISSEAKRLRKILSRNNKLEAWKLELKQIGKHAKKVAPAAGSLIPFVGAVTKRALEVAIADRDPDTNTAAAWLNHLLAICGILSTISPITIVVDDFHRLSSDEQSIVATLLGGLVEVENAQLRALISTRPTIENGDLAVSFQLPARNGELLRIELEPLSDNHLIELSHTIFANPGESQPLVDLAAGSPQRLLELMIKLNIHGDLAHHDNLVVLPTELTKFTYLIDSVWTRIESSKVLYDLAATMAIGTGSIALSDTSLIAGALGYDTKDILNAASTLEKLGIFVLESPEGIQSIHFSHDTLQDQIAARIASSSKISFAFYNDVTARFLEAVIMKLETNTQTNFKDVISLNVARARCLRDSAAAGWEGVVLHVASECVSNGRFRMGAELVGPLLKQLSGVSAADDPQVSQASAIGARCNYAIGIYKSVVNVQLPKSLNDPYADYAVIMASIIEKNKGWFEKAIQQLEWTQGKIGYDKYEPLFQSAWAIALRENDDVTAGEKVLDELINRSSDQFDPIVWHQFLAIASVFRPAEEGTELAKMALEFFEMETDSRMVGIAATNLSILYTVQSEFDQALEAGIRAEAGFKDANSEDVIFPLLNQAAILLSTGRADLALPQLRSCLFRQLPDERRLAVLNNLALAQWATGKKFDVSQLLDETKNGENAWLRWISRINLAFLELDGGKAHFDLSKITTLRDELLSNDPDQRSAPFWNWLLDKYPQGDIEHLRFSSVAPKSALEGLAVPDRGIARPVFLSFGRI